MCRRGFGPVHPKITGPWSSPSIDIEKAPSLQSMTSAFQMRRVWHPRLTVKKKKSDLFFRVPFALFLEIDILFSFYVFPHVSQAQAGLGKGSSCHIRRGFICPQGHRTDSSCTACKLGSWKIKTLPRPLSAALPFCQDTPNLSLLSARCGEHGRARGALGTSLQLCQTQP